MTAPSYQEVDGIRCYAIDKAYHNTDYPSGEFDKTLEIEKHSFWYKSRNRILKHLFARFLGTQKEKKILEIGCGTGYVLQGLTSYPNFKLAGADIYLDGLKFAQKKLPGIDFFQLDATQMPFANEFDAMGAFDVIEHIEEDVLVMSNLNKALKSKGYLFVTVPQHMFLWSKTDEIGFHKRRYSRKELTSKLRTAGFDIEFVTSFVFTLLPFMMISRFINKYKKIEAGDTSNHPGPLSNAVFNVLVKFDELFIKWGISLPAGGSLVVVAKKRV